MDDFKIYIDGEEVTLAELIELWKAHRPSKTGIFWEQTQKQLREAWAITPHVELSDK